MYMYMIRLFRLARDVWKMIDLEQVRGNPMAKFDQGQWGFWGKFMEMLWVIQFRRYFCYNNLKAKVLLKQKDKHNARMVIHSSIETQL